jgi:hypothetical protein
MNINDASFANFQEQFNEFIQKESLLYEAFLQQIQLEFSTELGN